MKYLGTPGIPQKLCLGSECIFLICEGGVFKIKQGGKLPFKCWNIMLLLYSSVLMAGSGLIFIRNHGIQLTKIADTCGGDTL